VKVDADWPADGEVVFNNVSIRYSGNACPVARNLNIHIQPGEKVFTARPVLLSPRKRGIMESPALVCLSVCYCDN